MCDVQGVYIFCMVTEWEIAIKVIHAIRNWKFNRIYHAYIDINIWCIMWCYPGILVIEISRLRLCKMRVLTYYVEHKALFEA